MEFERCGWGEAEQFSMVGSFSPPAVHDEFRQGQSQVQGHNGACAKVGGTPCRRGRSSKVMPLRNHQKREKSRDRERYRAVPLEWIEEHRMEGETRVRLTETQRRRRGMGLGELLV